MSAASSRSRVFSVGDSILELVSASPDSASSSRRGMDHLRIAVRDFNPETVARVLRERGIASSTIAGAVRISDPDGIRIELAAAS